MKELLIYQQKLKYLLMESSRQVWLTILMVQNKCVLDNRHACPELLAILEEDLNVLAGGKCRKNRKVFPLKDYCLTLPRGCEKGIYKCLYNFCFHLVDTQWKDSKTL